MADCALLIYWVAFFMNLYAFWMSSLSSPVVLCLFSIILMFIWACIYCFYLRTLNVPLAGGFGCRSYSACLETKPLARVSVGILVWL